MVLQFEDPVNVIKITHPSYDFVLLFDRAAGHAKQRPDGLNQHSTNCSFRGKIASMRSTVIEQEEGYLGPFPRSLGPEDTQLLVFSSLNIGPFWQTEKEESGVDKHLGSTSYCYSAAQDTRFDAEA